MSSSTVLDRPTEATETRIEWVILDEAPLALEAADHSGVEIRGHGADRYGAISKGGITAAPPNLVVLPPVDELD